MRVCIHTFLKGEPLLADPTLLSAAFDACSADESAKREALKMYSALREEIKYQTSKTYDPRWPDPDDAADLQASVKKLKSAVERCLASVPPAKRGAASG